MLAARLRIVMGACGIAAVVGAGGCRQAAQQDDRRASGIMAVLGLEYGEYLASHRNAPPAKVGDFRAFLESRPEKLKEYRVTSIDELLTSPRDHQAISIVCGVAQPVLDEGGYALAAYEAEGVDGKRLVSSARGGVVEMTAAEFSAAFPSLGP
jgi:hypothetical protein